MSTFKNSVVDLSTFWKSEAFQNHFIRFLGSKNIRKVYDYVTYDYKMDFEIFSLTRQHEKGRGQFEHFPEVWGFPKPFHSISWVKQHKKRV